MPIYKDQFQPYLLETSSYSQRVKFSLDENDESQHYQFEKVPIQIDPSNPSNTREFYLVSRKFKDAQLHYILIWFQLIPDPLPQYLCSISVVLWNRNTSYIHAVIT